MKVAIALLIWGIALFGNVIGWVVIGNNANERYPVAVFVTCIIALALAGWLTSKKLEFAGWGAVVGVALACALVFMV